MADYQISARGDRDIRVGQDDQTVGTFRRGRWIRDVTGEVEGHEIKMKLPAPWRGMRYRLEEDGREIASAGRPKDKQRIVRFEMEMPGRRLELVAQDRHGLEYLLLEGGEEIGRYVQRSFSEQDEWTADFTSREDSAPLAAFVAWLVLEARPFHRS